MTHAVVRPASLISGATSRFRRVAARLERSLRSVAMTTSTYRALEALPDEVLRDIGLARSEIPFVAGAVASRHCKANAEAASLFTSPRLRGEVGPPPARLRASSTRYAASG